MPTPSRFKTYQGNTDGHPVEWMIDFEEIDLYSEQRSDGGLSLSLLWRRATRNAFDDMLEALDQAVEMSEDPNCAFRGMDHETRVDMQLDIKRHRNNTSDS